AFVQKTGGYLSEADLAEYRPEWVSPISMDYRGYGVHEIPPNGQGVAALMALNLLKGFELEPHRETARNYHLQIESMKLAFADAAAFVADARYMDVSAASLLSEDYANKRRALIGETASLYKHGAPPRGGTVYLAAADAAGNMVSYIQSNYMGFGSGVVVRGTGISLQNRGSDFSLDPAHSNCVAPRKKTYHTIIPGFILKDGEAVGPFGVMGGYMQPQGHVQAVMNLVDFGMNPQQALDAPRWQWTDTTRFLVENTFSAEIAKQLAARGHRVEIALDSSTFGRGQVILRTPTGALVGGTERRTDSNIACY
ncbi:MAG: gamma-glutamyltransferase family protein, partial [Clostridia bacterium]|nr:gamma-glutamyltransferase family protein [Clostridia bacterium]